MDISNPTPDPQPDAAPQPQQPQQPARHRSRRWRGFVAGAAAGAMLTAGVGGTAVWATHDSATPTTSAAGSSSSSATTSDQTQPAFDPYSGGYPGGFSGGYSGYGGYADSSGQTTTTTAEPDATEAQSAGVVLIDTTVTGGTAAGTGMVLDADGLVLTNYHVVEDSTSVQVTVATTGETYDATVVGHDATADVALLQLDDASGLSTVTLDEDTTPVVSDAVTAIGNAEGQGYLSASSGSVTDLDQPITTQDSALEEGESLTGLIETDAYVVGGYSGGALLDAQGEVVGMTTAASSGSVVESYAIPIDDALAVVDQIESGTETASVEIGPSAYLGVALSTDLQVAEVEDGTPAEGAGLAAGDTLTTLDGTPLTDLDALSSALAKLEPDDSVTLGWTDTSGATQQAEVTLGSSPVA